MFSLLAAVREAQAPPHIPGPSRRTRRCTTRRHGLGCAGGSRNHRNVPQPLTFWHPSTLPRLRPQESGSRNAHCSTRNFDSRWRRQVLWTYTAAAVASRWIAEIVRRIGDRVVFFSLSLSFQPKCNALALSTPAWAAGMFIGLPVPVLSTLDDVRFAAHNGRRRGRTIASLRKHEEPEPETR